jgi:hypothetical protein
MRPRPGQRAEHVVRALFIGHYRDDRAIWADGIAREGSGRQARRATGRYEKLVRNLKRRPAFYVLDMVRVAPASRTPLTSKNIVTRISQVWLSSRRARSRRRLRFSLNVSPGSDVASARGAMSHRN